MRGSHGGKAAEIISDATTLREIEEEPHNVEQTAMWQLLEKIGLSKPKPEQTQYNYETLISKLQTFCEKRGDERDADIDADVVKLVKNTYNFGGSNDEKKTKKENVEKTRTDAYTLLMHAFMAANTGKCWVFDLRAIEGDDFNGALLKCLLNGMTGNDQDPKTELAGIDEDLEWLSTLSPEEQCLAM